MRLSLPGTYGQQVLDALQIAACDLDNYISGGAGLNAHEQLERYAEWAMESALRLEAFLSTDAIARLVLTRTYHTIVAAGPTASERSLNSLLHIETSARRRHLSHGA